MGSWARPGHIAPGPGGGATQRGLIVAACGKNRMPRVFIAQAVLIGAQWRKGANKKRPPKKSCACPDALLGARQNLVTKLVSVGKRMPWPDASSRAGPGRATWHPVVRMLSAARSLAPLGRSRARLRDLPCLDWKGLGGGAPRQPAGTGASGRCTVFGPLRQRLAASERMEQAGPPLLSSADSTGGVRCGSWGGYPAQRPDWHRSARPAPTRGSGPGWCGSWLPMGARGAPDSDHPVSGSLLVPPSHSESLRFTPSLSRTGPNKGGGACVGVCGAAPRGGWRSRRGARRWLVKEHAPRASADPLP